MANILKGIDKIVTSDGNTTVDLANIQATGGAGSVNNTDLGISMSETTSAIYYDLNAGNLHAADGHSSSASLAAFIGGYSSSNEQEITKSSFSTAASASGYGTLRIGAATGTAAPSDGSIALFGFTASSWPTMDTWIDQVDLVGGAGGSTYGTVSSGGGRSGISGSSDGSKAQWFGGYASGGVSGLRDYIDEISFTGGGTATRLSTVTPYKMDQIGTSSNGTKTVLTGGHDPNTVGVTDAMNELAFADGSSVTSFGSLSLDLARGTHSAMSNGSVAMLVAGITTGNSYGGLTGRVTTFGFDSSSTSVGTLVMLSGGQAGSAGSCDGNKCQVGGGWTGASFTTKSNINEIDFDGNLNESYASLSGNARRNVSGASGN